MFKSKIISVLLLSVAALSAGAAEVKLPMKMEDVAESLKSHCPEHITVEAQNDVLTITVSETERKIRFEKTHAISLKRIAGRTITIMLDIDVENGETGGAKAPHSIGRITFSGTTQNLIPSKKGWHTCVFKNVKIPGNGLLKMHISLKNVPGKVGIRNPRVAYRGISSKSRSNSKKSSNSTKKKKKKSDD